MYTYTVPKVQKFGSRIDFCHKFNINYYLNLCIVFSINC